MKNTRNFSNVFLLLLALSVSFSLKAQDDPAVINSSRTAIKSGNAHELIKYFNEMVELNILGQASNYSKTQAEFILKDFFRKYPPTDFQFSHRGSSKQGVVYAIGSYTSGSQSFKIYILVKQFNGNYLIDTLNISEN